MDNERLIRNLSVPKGKIDCVLDTDTFNEIDDQFALSLMVKSEKCNVRGLFAAPFLNDLSESPADGMEKSYNEILNLLTLMGREDLKKVAFRGSEKYLPDEKTPVASEAASKLCELAAGYSADRPLYVVAIGCITNVASAVLMDKSITDKIVVVWLGGHDIHWPDTREFNMYQDIAAARVVFDCGCPLVQLPCMGVVSSFYATGPELEYYLRGKNKLCDYLADHTIEAAENYAKGRVWSRVIWDVTAVGWLLNDGDRFMDSRLMPKPLPEYDGTYSFDSSRQIMRYVTYIKRDALMGELFETLAKKE